MKNSTKLNEFGAPISVDSSREEIPIPVRAAEADLPANQDLYDDPARWFGIVAHLATRQEIIDAVLVNPKFFLDTCLLLRSQKDFGSRLEEEQFARKLRSQALSMLASNTIPPAKVVLLKNLLVEIDIHLHNLECCKK